MDDSGGVVEVLWVVVGLSWAATITIVVERWYWFSCVVGNGVGGGSGGSGDVVVVMVEVDWWW